MILTRYSLKSARESLCLAQARLGQSDQERHASSVLSDLIADIDRQRPVGPDGTHGDRHTATCGCEDR